MEREDFLLAHLRDLSRRTYQNAYLTHSNFLSEAELARASDMLSREGMSGQGNAPFFSYGGNFSMQSGRRARWSLYSMFFHGIIASQSRLATGIISAA